LNSVGGPLDRIYVGSAQIAWVWSEVAKQAHLKVSIQNVKENANRAGTTAMAELVLKDEAVLPHAL